MFTVHPADMLLLKTGLFISGLSAVHQFCKIDRNTGDELAVWHVLLGLYSFMIVAGDVQPLSG